MDAGQRIRDRRKVLGISQRELAARLGISFQAVQRWERGETFPRKDTLPRLLEILEAGADWLVGIPQVSGPDISMIPPDVLEAVRDPRMQQIVRTIAKALNSPAPSLGSNRP